MFSSQDVVVVLNIYRVQRYGSFLVGNVTAVGENTSIDTAYMPNWMISM